MAVMFNLPPELLDTIIEHCDDLDTFRKLALVSKAFNSWVNPHLYHTFRDTPHEYLTLISERKLRNFVRTLCQRPDLAEHVRSIQLGRWNRIPGEHLDIPELPHIRPLDVATLNYFARMAYAIGLLRSPPPHLDFWRFPHNIYHDKLLARANAAEMDAWDEKWLFYMEHGLNDALIILLVALCPKVKEVILKDIPGVHLSWHALARARHGFRSLQRFSATVRIGSLTRTMVAQFAPLMSAPCLQKVELRLQKAEVENFGNDVPENRDVRAGNGHANMGTCLPFVSNITRLELNACSLSPTAAKNLIQGCRALRSLQFSSCWEDRASDQLSMRYLGELLQSQCHSLETLTLRMVYYPNYNHAIPNVGSLQGFACLTKIYIRESSLLDPVLGHRTDLTTLLPRSLRTLIIEVLSDKCVNPLLDLARNRAMFPNLELVQLDDRRERIGLDKVDEMRIPFRDAGVKFVDDKNWKSLGLMTTCLDALGGWIDPK